MLFLKKYYLGLFFLIATIAGTLSHEFGHYAVARLQGYKAIITYNSTHRYTIDNKEVSFTKEDEEKARKDYFWFILGGPLSTAILGSLGLIVLLLVKQLEQKKWLRLAFVFLALFWLRFPFIALSALVNLLITGTISYFSDEAKLALFFDLNTWGLTIGFAVIGGLVVAIVFFKTIKPDDRKHFIYWAILSTPLSYILWFHLVGPALLP